MMNIPDSMKKDLGAWNNGDGIDMESWIACSGNYSLAVGYATIFCPDFIEFEGYILGRSEVTDQTISSIRGFENQSGSTPKSVEWVINHLHISDLHYAGCEDLTRDKILIIGEKLKSIYEARLAYLYSEKPCIVEFYEPEEKENLEEYQLSFWQKKHELKNT